MEASRARTLEFVRGLDDATLCAWPDEAFSPLCWHLGHIAFTEAFWALGRCGGDTSLSKPRAHEFAQDGRPKHERAQGYERERLFEYLADVRSKVKSRWPFEHALAKEGYLGWFLAAHEDQHRETMTLVRDLCGNTAIGAGEWSEPALPAQVHVAGSTVFVGTDSPLAYDNERPSIEVEVSDFGVDVHPATCSAWSAFAEAGGYEMREHWSDAGWAWKTSVQCRAPRGWAIDLRHRFGQPLCGAKPVMGISYYEAEAYARFRGGRLPTEVEWELAAQRFGESDPWLDRWDGPRAVRAGERPTDLIGNVWEWTADWFEPREGFEPHPYRGYSQPYFGGTHRTMRGGSFATSERIATSSFRNWFVPETRQVFVGVRVAYDV